MNPIRIFAHIESPDVEQVGGKGLSLGLMTKAGLPVPGGFCVTTEAYGAARRAGTPPRLDATARTAVAAAYHDLGGGLVAVRSSAIAEDSADASFAGQQESYLDIEGDANLLDAVERCWHSLGSERARAYRARQGVADEQAAMAVVVQRMVDAESSGVLFTRDPLDPTGQQMMIEASWGLGESVVSGRVTPDRYHIRRDDGDVTEQSIGDKASMQTRDGVTPVAADRRGVPCLNAAQLARLAELGRAVEAYFGGPRDVEWAYAGGECFLLQARPITAAGAYEREQLRRAEIAALQAKAEPRGTVWAKYNLAEILPAPTPMTWAIVRRFMSGRGGYGLMFRDLGFDPDPLLDDAGFIDLVCGRPYVNLSRESKLYFRRMPLAHSFKAIKANPALAFYPQATPDPESVTAGFLIRLPAILWRITRNASRLKRQPRTYADYLRAEAFPRFAAEVAAVNQEDWTALPPSQILERLQYWIERTLQQFARESLRPSVFAGNALSQLETALKKALGNERAAAGVRELLAGVHPDPEADLARGLRDLQAGRLERGPFLARFGHRGPLEMELAQPRWSEAADGLPALAASGSAQEGPTAGDAVARWRMLAAEAKLAPAKAAALELTVHHALTYSALRETAKHYFMLGYGLIRRGLIALDERFNLKGGIFFLEPTELPDLIGGADLGGLIAKRKRGRALALSLEVPPVLFSDDLEAVGRPPSYADGEEMRGVPLSAGSVEGPALVLEEPVAPITPPEGYILVCPSTDPAWVPLFLQAKGLVMETGGVLSHGAIVAREFHLPAVAGISHVHRRLRTGQRLRVDGNTGTVYLLD